MNQQRWRPSDMRLKTMSSLSEGAVFAAYDLETTGLYPYTDPNRWNFEKKSKGVEASEIIEFAGIQYEYRNHEFIEIKRLQLYIKPEKKVPAKIEELTGITNEFLADKPKMSQCVKKIFKFINEADIILGYNNHNFDNLFLDNLFKNFGLGNTRKPKVSLDVIEMARDLTSDTDILDKVGLEDHAYKLCNVNTYYDGPSVKYHDALDDVEATGFLFGKFVKMYPERNWNIGCGTKRPYIKKVYKWQNPKQQRMTRIKVIAEGANFFYDIFGKYWGSVDENINDYDMSYIRSAVLSKTCSKDEQVLARTVAFEK